MDVREICYGGRHPASSLALDLVALPVSQDAEASLSLLLKGHIRHSPGERAVWALAGPKQRLCTDQSYKLCVQYSIGAWPSPLGDSIAL